MASAFSSAAFAAVKLPSWNRARAIFTHPSGFCGATCVIF